MINDRDKKDHYFGDDLFDDARMAAPIAKAIVERMYGKGSLGFNKNHNTDQGNKEGREILKKIRMKKLHKVFTILLPIVLIAEVIAFLYGEVYLFNDIKIIAIVVIGFLYTKKKVKSYT